MRHPYSLNEPLPAGVFPHHWQRSAQYLNYPVFSWNWYRRRAYVYVPMGAFFGAVMCLPIGALGGEWRLLIGALWRIVPSWILIMLMGTALATWVREKDLGPPRERQWIVAGVLVGTLASFGLKGWYEAYLFETVRPVLLTKNAQWLLPQLSNSRAYEVFYDILVGYIVLSASGGRALINYFYELRRWQSHGDQQVIATFKQQRDESDRRLAVLQAQVEPHFLYNTLASIRSLVRMHPERAEATIDALVDHLRATLPKFRDASSVAATLGDQLEICRSYLEVMRVRTGGRLAYSVDADPDLAGLAFPPLMLISLVENAVKHGVEPKPGPCSVIVTARQVEEDGSSFLYATVTDDGAGLREGPSEGVGLANIRGQLMARFGARALLRVRGNEAGGVVASLRIPIDEVVR